MPGFVKNIALLLLICAGMARADSWAPPTPKTYESADGQARVIINPRPLDGALPYFQDKVAGKAPAGQRTGNAQVQPFARLERRHGGQWQAVWEVPLVNDVGPVSALVARDGRYLVTFDNWHSAGHGPDVVVIYDGEGKLVRQLALKDFLPGAYVALLPRSVSSLWWSGEEHSLDDNDETLVLLVRVPVGHAGFREKPASTPVRIRLADGQVLAHAGKEWERAMAAVTALDAERQARWREARALRASELRAPSGTDANEWREYLVELRGRLNDSTGHRHAGLVLPMQNDKGRGIDSADGIKGLIDEFESNREFSTTHFVFVSPSSTALAALLARHLASVKPGALQGAQISFVGTPEEGRQVADAAARSGAQIVLIDKAAPFPPGSLPEEVPEWFQ